MAKTILVPIDFSIESLNTLRLALEGHHTDKLKIILLYAQYLTDSITELLFYSPQKIIQTLSKPDFQDAIAILKNRHETAIDSIKIELIHSYNHKVFEAFLEKRKVEEIYVPTTYTLKPGRKGFDPIPLLRRSSVPVHGVAWELDGGESDHLKSLFK